MIPLFGDVFCLWISLGQMEVENGCRSSLGAGADIYKVIALKPKAASRH